LEVGSFLADGFSGTGWLIEPVEITHEVSAGPTSRGVSTVSTGSTNWSAIKGQVDWRACREARPPPMRRRRKCNGCLNGAFETSGTGGRGHNKTPLGCPSGVWW